ncbi:nucleotidyltransferase domain-containing protein [Hoyosella sp. YIM 151337]|uniref:nucleotidyltransferase domain-containing protein n=1 Tax=Hoyosella sp. YIM 151337 TaxID=2992742 RepID=UPI0022359B63|nr:nucleotidyltransferase domain-containing protein [Hoyosella sp. YIM 151337]MCW4354223.1 nucleotidyltransferase domain-containing protein [Hoyosella sp. YIM 151337]
MSEASLLNQTVEALREAGARFALIFGSRARGDDRPDSDYDVAAWWDHDPPQAFDVLVPPRVDLVVVNTAPLELRGRIAVDGKVLFEDSPEDRVHWVATTRKIYFDELPRIERAHRDFAQGVLDGR